MEEKVVEAEADPEAVARLGRGPRRRPRPHAAGGRDAPRRDGDPQAEGQALLRRAGEGAAALRRRVVRVKPTATTYGVGSAHHPSTGRCAVHVRVKLAVAVAVTGAMAVAGTAAIAGGGARSSGRCCRLRGGARRSRPRGSATFRANVTPVGNGFCLPAQLHGVWRAASPQAHIHFGQKAVNGGSQRVPVLEPRQPARPRAGTPACPPPPATVTGTITRPTWSVPRGRASRPASWRAHASHARRRRRTPTSTARCSQAARSADRSALDDDDD